MGLVATAADPEHVVLELGQLPGAFEHLAVDNVGRVALGVAMLLCLHIEHELRERTVQPRHRAAQETEARAGELGTEVEIEPDTGHIEIVRYLVVDDFGTVINPLLLRGQVQGGVGQGVGQAMLERCVFDPETGQLLTGSLTDYCLPRADDLPAIEFAYNVVPCRTNPLGVKGAGEAGAIGAPPALVNAVVEALGELGIEHLDMPLTPERVWAAIRAVAGGKAA